MGCTHVTDPTHQERFWHPPIPGELAQAKDGWGRAASSGGSSTASGSGGSSPLNKDVALCGEAAAAAAVEDGAASPASLSSPHGRHGGGQFACHECGLYFQRLGALRLHLQRKTAWSNRGLVGARVSCLVDSREWQEGAVLEFSAATRKHHVVFEQLQQARWMHMQRAAFFILRRPALALSPSPSLRQQQQQQQEEEEEEERLRGGGRRRRRRRMVEVVGEELDDEGGESDEGAEMEEEEEEEAKQAEGAVEVEVWEVEDVDRPMEALLAPLEAWDHTEPLSLGYAFAQACLHEAYGRRIQETGHKTLGHLCVTETDKEIARGARSSLLYGELLPRGINKALLPGRLDGARAGVIYELGMGVGKVAMQCFLQFPTSSSTAGGGLPRRVFGVELSSARYDKAEAAARRLVAAQPERLEVVEAEGVAGARVVVRNRRCGALLELEAGNLLAVEGLETADIVLLETDLGATIYPDLCALLRRMKPGARAFTYLDLRKIWGVASPPPADEEEGALGGSDAAAGAGAAGGAEVWDAEAAGREARRKAGAFPFRQLDVNRPVSDRYATSWSVNRGHHFYLWVKVLGSGCDAPAPPPAEWEGGAETWVPDAIAPPPPAGAPSSAAPHAHPSSSSSSSVRGKAPPRQYSFQGKEERGRGGAGGQRRAYPVYSRPPPPPAPRRQPSSASSSSSGGGLGKALRRVLRWGGAESPSRGATAASTAAAASPSQRAKASSSASSSRSYDEAAAAAAAAVSSSTHPQLSASASYEAPLP